MKGQNLHAPKLGALRSDSQGLHSLGSIGSLWSARGGSGEQPVDCLFPALSDVMGRCLCITLSLAQYPWLTRVLMPFVVAVVSKVIVDFWDPARRKKTSNEARRKLLRIPSIPNLPLTCATNVGREARLLLAFKREARVERVLG